MHKYIFDHRWLNVGTGLVGLVGLVLAQACAPDATVTDESSGGTGNATGTVATGGASSAAGIQGSSGGSLGSAGTLANGASGSSSAFGGSSTGGSLSSTGGSSTGGSLSSTGGSSTGGSSTGGRSAGGSSTGGSSTGGSGAGGGAATASFASVGGLLGMKCSGMKCHGTGSMQAGFGTATGAALYTLLTSPLPAATPHCAGLTLVTAKDTNSPLLKILATGGKISCTMPKAEMVGPMPEKCMATAATATGSCFTTAQLKTLSDWIAAGAPMQ